jgi:hypothetical protein
MYLPRGKMLGGCSAISTSFPPQVLWLTVLISTDAQIYQHCAPSDYDDVGNLIARSRGSLLMSVVG